MSAVASLLMLVFAADPVKLIIDTDIGGGGCNDVDDVVAISIANVSMSHFLSFPPRTCVFAASTERCSLCGHDKRTGLLPDLLRAILRSDEEN